MSGLLFPRLDVRGEIMGKKDFEAYLEKHEQYSEEFEIDWVREKDEWLGYLEQLYEKIRNFLKDYTDSGDLSIEYGTKSINEESIGAYEAVTVSLKFRGNEVTLDPIGTRVIGARGRVDMAGSGGTVKFVLVDKQAERPDIAFTILFPGASRPENEEEETQNIEWDWKIVTPPPRIHYVELTDDSFFDSLMEVIDG
jgi:hypothetical protein